MSILAPSRQIRTQIIVALVLATFLCASTVSARLSNDVIPTRQKIYLEIDADTSDYSGSVEISLEVKATTKIVAFYAEEMELTSIILSGAEGEAKFSIEYGKHGLVTLTTETELKPGQFSLRIEFSNDFNTQASSLYRVIDNGEGYLFTQFEDIDARGAFPCWDEPVFKIPFSMTLKVPVGHLAISNTPIEEEKIIGDWKEVVFMETYPLPTYLLAIATGPLETVDVPGMKIPTRMVTVRGKSGMTGLAASLTPPILNALEEYFGRPYPYRKLDLIAVPEFWAGAMENAGAITFRQTILVHDDAVSVAQRRRLIEVIAHELAHMWFGDLVTMVWWDDLWLNESFASWMGTKVSDQLYPEFNLPVRQVRVTQRVMGSDALKTSMPIRMPTEDVDNLLSNIGVIYNKGEAVLGMVESYLGEEAFRKGVNDYLNKHEWGSAVASDFWSALSEASGVDAEAILSTFVLQAGVPVIAVKIGQGGEVTLSQSRFGNYGTEFSDESLWQVPITLKYGVDGETKYFSHLLTTKEETIRLPGEQSPDWILPNANMTGYYRWTLPTEMLLSLAENSTEALTVAERIGLIGNLSGLLDAGILSGVELMKVLSEFSSDTDAEVIATIISELNGIKASFVTEDLKSDFSNYVRMTLKPALSRFGMEKRENEISSISSMRPSLIWILASDGNDQEVMAFANELGKLCMEDPSKVDPSLATTVIGLKAMEGDEELYEEYLRRFEEASLPAERSRYLAALGDFRDDRIIERALKYAVDGDLRPQERGRIPLSIAGQSSDKADQVFDWMMTNWDSIIQVIPKISRPRLTRFASGCSRERLAKAIEFFSTPERTSNGMEIQLQRIAERVEDCVGLREREGPAVADYLKSLGKSSN